MKDFKHSDRKPPQPPRNPGRDFHSAKEKEVHTKKESARSHGSKDSKHK